jgi:hypothetical protein
LRIRFALPNFNVPDAGHLVLESEVTRQSTLAGSTAAADQINVPVEYAFAELRILKVDVFVSTAKPLHFCVDVGISKRLAGGAEVVGRHGMPTLYFGRTRCPTEKR